MAVVFTLILFVALELAGLYVAGNIGYAIRSAFRKNSVQNSSTRVRWQNVLIGYSAIVGFFILLLLL